MADANARINIDINTSQAAAALRSLQSQITAFNSTLTKSSAVQATALRNSSQNLLELVNASRFFSAETVKMQTAASSLDKTLSKGQVTIGQYLGARFRKNTLAAAQVMSLAQTRASALQTQFVATGTAANGMRDAIAIRPLQAFNNAAVVSAQKLAIQRAMLQQATTQMINFGKNTQWAGRQLMVGFTVPLTIFAGVAGKTFMDLEKEAVNFKKVYGDAFTPPEEMQANLDAVKELAKEYTKYGIAVKDTVGLAAEAAAAGAQNQELIDATTQATRLGTLGQMEQNEALKTTISLQNAFKLSGDELANSINFLNMVENQTVVTLQDLSGAIPRVAPVIKGLGGDVRDLAAFLAAMQEGGVSAAQGAQALKSGLASLINPTDKAKETLQEMGISLDTIIQANRGDLMGTVQALADALDGLDQFSRQQAIEQIFGKFQYARLAALFDNINKEGTQAARVLEITSMSAAEMAASAEKELSAIEEAVGTKFTAAMEKLQLAIAPIGELFLKMAIPVVNFFTSVIDKFNQLPDFAKTFSAFAAVIIGIVIPTGTMFLGLLMNLIGTLIKFGALVGTAFKGFTSGGFKGAFDAVSQSLKYMSLAELDAVNSAQQLAGSTEAVNQAFLEQVTASDGAQAAVMELAYAYEILTQQMREAAAANKMAFGVGAGAMGAAAGRGPRVRRNRGGTIPGSGNTDTVPAMLTPGEFVVNKQATQDNLALLKQINEGGKVPRFNIGGLLAATGAAVRSRSLLSSSQVATGLGVSERTLRRMSASVGLPKTAGRYEYTPEILPLLQAQSTVRMQKTHTTPFKSMTSLSSTIPGTSQRARLSKLMADAGIPIQVVDDAWIMLPAGINQKLRGKGVSGKLLLEAIEDFSKTPGFFGPAYKNVNKEQFLSNLRSSIRTDGMYTDYGQAGGLNAGSLFWSAARKSAPKDGFIPTQVGGYTANTETFRKSVGKLNKKYAGQYSFYLDESGKKPLMQVFDSKGNRVLTEDIQASAGWGFNKGSIVPGIGNKDTVPAMLTPGEFVINKQATQSNRALLEAINNGEIKGYRKGGHVQTQNIQGVRSFVVLDEQGQEVGRFSSQKEANKALRSYRRQMRTSRVSGAMRGGRGMGIGMGMGMLGSAMFMGSGMMPNQGASTAMQIGGTALGIGSMIPMMGGMGGIGAMLAPLAGIAAPAAAVAAGLAVAGVAAYKWRDSVDSAARKAAEFGSNLGGTANAFNQIASLMGTQTPAQRQAALQMGFGEEEQVEIAQEFQNIFGSEQGQAFIKDLEEATSEERFKKLSDYLKAGIAAGIMDKEMATGLAKAVSLTLGDTILGAKTVGAIAGQETGAAAVADIAQVRADEVSSIKEFTRVVQEEGRLLDQADAAKIIGGSIQTIQDFSNASALAREQLANGEITQAEYNKIIEQSESQQALFTKAIEESLMHTTDFGGTMQGTLDQLTKAGLATEEGLNKLREAAESAAFSNVVGEAGTQQSLMAAGVSAISAGMGEATVAETVSLIGEVGSAAQIAFENLSGQVGGAQALQGAALVSQISTGQMFGESVAPIQQDILAANAERFAREGGDIVGLQSMLLSQASLEDRVSLAEDFFTLSDSDQNQLITDYQNLASTLGTEFSNKIIQSSEYEEALAAGTADELVKSITEASEVFGDKTQEIMDYAEKTGQSFSTLTQYGKDIQDLGQEAVFRLGIDITNPKDLEKFGPIADSLSKNWPILQNLNKEIDMSAYIEFLTVDGEGNDLSAKEVYENTKDLNKAWREAGNLEDLEARKSAIFELRTLQNGVQMPLESYNTIWNDLIKEYGKKVIQKLPTSVLTKVISLELQLAASESSVKAAKEALATGNLTGSDRAFANAIVAREGQAASQIRAEIEQDVYGSAFGPSPSTTGSGGGSGGTPEKTISEKLSEQFKNLKDTYKSMKRFVNSETGEFKSIVAGPFGPEFIEFLKSQGEEGLKILNGKLSEMKKVYKEYKRVQRQEAINVFQMLPGNLSRQLEREQSQFEFRDLLSQEGFQEEEADILVESIPPDMITQYVRLNNLRNNGVELTKKQKNNLEIIDRLLKQSITPAQGLANQRISAALRDQERDIAAVENILKAVPGASQQTIDSLLSLGITSETSAQGIQRAAASLDNLTAKAYAAQPALVKLNNTLTAQAGALQAQLSFNQYTVVAPMEAALQGLQEQLSGLDRAIEMKQRSIRSIQREIELEERLKKPIEDRIEELQEEQEVVDENYNNTIDSLEKVERLNERIARQRQGRMDVASALSRGDVAAAAQAALDMQRSMAEMRQEDTREGIDASFDEQRKNIEEAIRAEREKIEEIDARIEERQLSIRAIQDEIFEIENQRLALQDQIYQKQLEIEAARKRQLEIEKQIARIQMVQSMIETQQQIRLAAQQGDTATLGFLTQTLDFQNQAMEFDPEFANIPGVQPILELTGDILAAAQGSAEQIKAAFEKAGFALTGQAGEGGEGEGSGGIEKAAQDMVDTATGAASILKGEPTGEEGEGEGKGKKGKGKGKKDGGGLEQGAQDMVDTMDESVIELQKLTGGGKESDGEGILPIGVAVIDEQMDFIQTEFKKLPDIASRIVGHMNAAEASLRNIATAISNIQIPKTVGRMYGGVIRRAFGGMINYKGSREPAPGMMMGGKVKKFAFGSFVPGSGMTDKVPALLTPGEFVVRKSVAQQMMPALKAMNSQVFPGMGIPQQRSFSVSSPQFDTMRSLGADSVRFGVPQNINSYTYPQTSVMVTQSNMDSNPITTAIGPSNVQYTYNLNVNANTNASPDDIANTVMYKIKRFDDRRIRGTQVG